MTELPIDENTPRILIVEDEPKLGQLLIDYLRAASYAPTLISHGDQVLPYVRQTPPDLILLDLMLLAPMARRCVGRFVVFLTFRS